MNALTLPPALVQRASVPEPTTPSRSVPASGAAVPTLLDAAKRLSEHLQALYEQYALGDFSPSVRKDIALVELAHVRARVDAHIARPGIVQTDHPEGTGYEVTVQADVRRDRREVAVATTEGEAMNDAYDNAKDDAAVLQKLAEPKRCTVFKVVMEVYVTEEDDYSPDEKDVREQVEAMVEAHFGWPVRIKDVQPWATGEAVPE